MELNIHDKTLKYVGVINNNLPEALHYFDDKWHRYLAEGSSTFEFSVPKNNPDFSLIQESSYISFYYENEDYLFNIIGTKEDDKNSLAVSCVNLNLGLLYETLNAYSNTKRHSIVWYLKNAAKISDNILEIGQNPFSEVDEDKSNPILTFDSSETKLARIISICSSFSAEFKFSTKLKDDGTLQSITLDLFKAGGVGQVRKDVTLYYGKNITGITRTMDKKSIFNATTVTDSKNKYNWKAVEGKYYNSEGQLEFYKNTGENTAYALISRDTFPSQLKSDTNDQWVRKDFSIEASSEDSLWDYAVSQFKQFAYPQMTYEVSATSTAVTNALGDGRLLDIGDTVTIQDGNFDKADGGLILSARVSEQEISFTNPSSNSVTFTNFVKLKNQISADLWSKMKDIVDQSTPYRSELTTSNGVQFKNSAGSTTLSAHIYFGKNPEETTADQYEWFKDGVSVGKGQDLTVIADDIDGKAVYAYEATLDEKVVGRQEVTITDVSDGLDGRAIVSVEQKYQTSKEQKAPTDNWENENWKTDMPFTDPENKYLWQINHITYSLAPLTSDSISLIGTHGDQGETSYTHVAYANTADGNDGFTTVYPNLNLEQHTEMLVDKSNNLLWGRKGSETATMTYDTLTIPESLEAIDAVRTTQTTTGQSGWRGPTGVDGSYPVTPGEKVSISAYVKNNAQTTVNISLQIGVSANANQSGPKYLINRIDVPGDGQVHLLTGTLEIPAGYNYAWSYVYAKNGTTSADFTFGRLKVEHGSTATPWMPSASEVTTADWPNYRGEYSDFTVDASTDPQKYIWTVIKGSDGEDGKDGHDVWNVTMTNGNMILPANALGGVLSYSNTGNSISVMKSSGDLLVPTDDLTKLSNNQFYVKAVGTNITPGTRTIDSENKVITFSNISNFPAEIGATGSISFEITVNVYGVVTKFSKLQNFTTSPQGITGNDGADTFTYIRYSNKSDGSDMVSLPNADSRFIGVYTGVAAIAPTDPKDYTWSRFNGATVLAQATEPEEAERFTGMLWQYTGTEDLSATGITVKANTIYQWTGKVWQLFVLKSTNLQVDNGFITNAMIGDAQIKLANIDTASINKLSVLSADLGEATAGSITLLKGETGGVSVKDGVVKTWDISKVTDPNYPDGYSYTSMGAALDSGGITFYSAGYGQKLNQEKVIDDKYKIATLSAVAGNGRQDGGVGLVLDASNPNFPLNIIGNVRIQDTIDLGKVKSVEVPLGWGRSVILTRVGNQVTMFSNKTFSGTMNQGLWSQANEKIPNGYKPYGQVYIYSVSIVNQSKFMWYRLGPSGGVEIWQNGNITTSDTMITPVQSWITSDGFPS